MSPPDNLPKGWANAELAELVEPRGEKAAPSGTLDTIFLGMDDIEPHTTRIVGGRPASRMKSAASRFQRGDVLYGRLRPYLNKVTIPPFDGLASAEFIVFPDTDIIRSPFLKHRLNAADFVSFASHLNEGDRPRVDFDQIGKFLILLPPPREQLRIVDKIDELFSELDKAVESLTTAREQLKAYRQSVLKHAFEGTLTADWRETNAEGIESAEELLKKLRTTTSTLPGRKKQTEPFTGEQLIGLPAAPPGWAWCKLDELAAKITDGEHFRPEIKDSGVYFLSAKDVKESGVCLDNPLFIDEETARRARLRCDPEKGDILMVSRGATVGRLCVVDVNPIFCLLGSVILIKPAVGIEPRFLAAALKSPSVNRLTRNSSGSTAQQAIYLRDLKQIPVPICSIAEQNEIVRLIDNKLSIANQFDNSIKEELQRVENLRSTILGRAFSGQLVAQDPDDEPASALLERIQSEKEKPVTTRESKKRGKGAAA